MNGRICCLILFILPTLFSEASRLAEACRTASAPFEKAPFDLSWVVNSLDKGTFSDKAYVVMDEAMKREKVLEDARKLAQKSSSKISERKKDQWERDYHFLKCRLRLLIGLSRAAIAQRMAQPSSRSYSSQAMELAIDSLRDAAKHSEKAEGFSPCLGSANPDRERILSFRSKLLDIWDRSQKQADVAPVRDMDLKKLVCELTRS